MSEYLSHGIICPKKSYTKEPQLKRVRNSRLNIFLSSQNESWYLIVSVQKIKLQNTKVRNGNLLKSRISEIRVKRIRVNQGVGVLLSDQLIIQNWIDSTHDDGNWLLRLMSLFKKGLKADSSWTFLQVIFNSFVVDLQKKVQK